MAMALAIVLRMSVESTRSYVLTGIRAALKRDQEDFVRWWVEDECGNVLEFHDDFSPPAKPMMWSLVG
jgi:hypothetical protein